jgi:hypothetical protein
VQTSAGNRIAAAGMMFGFPTAPLKVRPPSLRVAVKSQMIVRMLGS